MIYTGLTLYQKLVGKWWRFPDDFSDALDKINVFTLLLNDWDITTKFDISEYRPIIQSCERVGPTEVKNIYEEIFNMFGNKVYNQALLVSEFAYPELFPDFIYKKKEKENLEKYT